MIQLLSDRSGGRPLLWSLLLAVASLLLVLPVSAQSVESLDTITDDQVNEIAKDVYCPVCENTPLDVCPTKACEEWRELIRTKLAEGDSEEEIFAYFARQYGDGVLAKPPREGISLLLWVFPIVAVALGGVFFTRYMRDLRATPSAEDEIDAPPSPPSVSDDYMSRVEQELGK